MMAGSSTRYMHGVPLVLGTVPMPPNGLITQSAVKGSCGEAYRPEYAPTLTCGCMQRTKAQISRPP